MYRLIMVGALLLVMFVASAAATTAPLQPRSLDGSGNNRQHDNWGPAGTQYLRVADPNYADGIGRMPLAGPPPRYVSNRIFNDVGQNLFSENGVSQWGWAWGQFMDHDFGLRDETPAEAAPIAVRRRTIRWRSSRNDFGVDRLRPHPRRPGNRRHRRRASRSTPSSYIDASNVYGVTDVAARLAARRPVDGDPANNAATSDARRTATCRARRPRQRGDRAADGPDGRAHGRHRTRRSSRATCGRTRTSRSPRSRRCSPASTTGSSAALPASLPDEQKFQIARRVVGAEVQYITYNEFLPAMGVQLPGLPRATTRASTPASATSSPSSATGRTAWSTASSSRPCAEGTLLRRPARRVRGAGDRGRAQRRRHGDAGDPAERRVRQPRSAGAGRRRRDAEEPRAELEYKNDEQIDNSLRSVLFQVPKPGIPDPGVCGEPRRQPGLLHRTSRISARSTSSAAATTGCRRTTSCGGPSGCRRRTSFTDITGEDTRGSRRIR